MLPGRSDISRRLLVASTALLALLATVVTLASGTVLQQGNLRITLLSQIQPLKLPRHEQAPIAVFLSGHVDSVKKGVPPQLQSLSVKVNRHGKLDGTGLPVCPVSAIQPSTTERAVDVCGPAIIGSGQFWAHIVLPDQEPNPTHGRLLVFNGRTQGGRPAILAHIFTADPFATSFVIAFRITDLEGGGQYGTQLSASLPKALGEWGYVDRIKLTLRRKYRYRGQQRSYFSANCPAAAGTRAAVYPIALATFSFQSQQLTTRVSKACRVLGE